MATLDHFILETGDIQASAAFYTRVPGFSADGQDGPFTVIRVNPQLCMLLARHAPASAAHYAFALPGAEFEAVFARIRQERVPYGPSFCSVGSNTGPGREAGARGMAKALYFKDPSGHLLEIRCYDD